MIRVLGKHFTGYRKGKKIEEEGLVHKNAGRTMGRVTFHQILKCHRLRKRKQLTFKTYLNFRDVEGKKKKKGSLQNGPFSDFKGCPRLDTFTSP